MTAGTDIPGISSGGERYDATFVQDKRKWRAIGRVKMLHPARCREPGTRVSGIKEEGGCEGLGMRLTQKRRNEGIQEGNGNEDPTYCPASSEPVAKPRPPHIELIIPALEVEVFTTTVK